MFSFATTFLALSLALSPFSAASPLTSRDALEVYDPPITSPAAGDVWPVGSNQTVTWNATGIPPTVTGLLELGYQQNNSENLGQVLAEGFDLSSGSISFAVPDVPPRDDYIVVLFGDSGNASPQFSIVPA